MADTSKIPETVRLIAERQGIARALDLFPDGVKAAFERGARPLGVAPKGTPALIHPAPVFDPSRFEKK